MCPELIALMTPTGLESGWFYTVSLEHADDFQLRHQIVMFMSKNRTTSSSVLPLDSISFIICRQLSPWDHHKSDYENESLCLGKKADFLLEITGHDCFDCLLGHLSNPVYHLSSAMPPHRKPLESWPSKGPSLYISSLMLGRKDPSGLASHVLVLSVMLALCWALSWLKSVPGSRRTDHTGRETYVETHSQDMVVHFKLQPS
jgi:hypothetical protein